MSSGETMARWIEINCADFLKDNLPDYMIPSVFFTLEKMPLLPNGKIDRRALPPIDPLHFNA